MPAEKIPARPQVSETPEERHLRAMEDRRREKSRLEQDVHIAELNTKIAEANRARQELEKKSPLEEMRESIAQHQAMGVGAFLLAREEKKTNKTKFADDPELLKRANESADYWLDQNASPPNG